MIAGLLVVPAALAGCSDVKAPNAANFRKAIEPIVVDSYCLLPQFTRLVQKDGTGSEGFPVFLTAKSSDFDPGRDGRATLEDAVRTGLAKKTEVQIVAKHAGSADAPVRQAAIRYEPTAAGASHLRPVKAMTVGHTEATFAGVCGGKGELVDIVRWTEPADVLGQRVTQVTYTQKGTDPIAGLPAAGAAALEKVQQRTVPLMLASDGWRTIPR